MGGGHEDVEDGFEILREDDIQYSGALGYLPGDPVLPQELNDEPKSDFPSLVCARLDEMEEQ